MKIEKRGDPRTLIRIKVNCEADDAYLYDYSRDLSESGIFICVKNPLSVGEKIKLKFILPELLEEIEVAGEVTWSNPPSACEGFEPGMGIKFINLSPLKKALIQDVIAHIEGGRKK